MMMKRNPILAAMAIALSACVLPSSKEDGGRGILAEIVECRHSSDCLIQKKRYKTIDPSTEIASTILQAVQNLGPVYLNHDSSIEIHYEVEHVLYKRGRYIVVAIATNFSSADLYFYGDIDALEENIYFDWINPGWNGE